MTELRGLFVDRFWSYVDKSGDCWEWTGVRSEKGYGRIRLPNRAFVRAHRVAWELTYGPIPDGLLACHHCDNPPCVRPDHLFLGTAADNRQDAMAKGRLRYQTNRELRTACMRGHPFTPENTYNYPNPKRRRCRTCHRLWVDLRRDELNDRRRVQRANPKPQQLGLAL